MKLLCLFKHKICPYYDTEYSRRGECYFCERCGADFDEHKRRIV